jgi:CRP-like cAMP-binding protein
MDEMSYSYIGSVSSCDCSSVDEIPFETMMNSPKSIKSVKSTKSVSMSPKLSKKRLSNKQRERGNRRSLSIPPMQNIVLSAVNITNEDLEFDNIIQILSKKSKERSSKDVLIVSRFLEKTNLSNKFRSDSIYPGTSTANQDSLNIQRMLYFSSTYLSHKFIEKHKILFRTGDLGNKFYIVLKGRVNIMKPELKMEKITIWDYYKYLIKLRDRNEHNLLKLTLLANQEKVFVNFKDLENLEEICFQIKYRKTLQMRPSILELEKAFSEFRKDFSNNSNKMESILTNSQIDYESNSIKLRNFRLDNYKYLENELELREVTLYYNKIFLQKSEGEYFGEFSLENSNNQRTATVIADIDTHLGYLETHVYKEYISIEQQKIINKEILFFLDNFFFQTIANKLFEKKYFPMFLLNECRRGETLFKEGEEVNYLYFIREGEVELILNKSVLEIHKLSKYMKEISFQKDDDSEYVLQNEPKNYQKELNEKKKVKLFIYSWKEVLGMEEFYFGLNRLYQCKVVSDKAKIYKIAVNDLLNLLKAEKDCYKVIESKSLLKINTFLQRLIDVKNINFSMLDNSINYKNKMEQKTIQHHKNKNKQDFSINNNMSPLPGKNFEFKTIIPAEKKENILRVFRENKIKISKKIKFSDIKDTIVEEFNKTKKIKAALANLQPLELNVFKSPINSGSNNEKSSGSRMDSNFNLQKPLNLQRSENKTPTGNKMELPPLVSDQTRTHRKIKQKDTGKVLKKGKFTTFNYENQMIKKLELDLKRIRNSSSLANLPILSPGGGNSLNNNYQHSIPIVGKKLLFENSQNMDNTKYTQTICSTQCGSKQEKRFENKIAIYNLSPQPTLETEEGNYNLLNKNSKSHKKEKSRNHVGKIVKNHQHNKLKINKSIEIVQEEAINRYFTVNKIVNL